MNVHSFDRMRQRPDGNPVHAGLGDGAVLDETTKFQRPSQNTRVRGLAEADKLLQ